MLATHSSDQIIRPQSLRLPYGSYPARQYFDGDTDPNATTTTVVATATETSDSSELGDKGKAALEAIRIEKRDALKRATAAETELATLKADQQKAKDKQAEEQGQYQKLAEDRKAEIDTLTTDRDGLAQKVTDLEAEVQGYRDAAETDYQTAVKLLPKELVDLAPEGDLTQRRAWLAKAQKSADAFAKSTAKGNGPNPTATGPATERLDQEARQVTESLIPI